MSKKLSYDELVAEIRSCSISYLPALLRVVVEECTRKPVFAKNRIITFINNSILDCEEEMEQNRKVN